jgi:hypothetical protein
MDKSIEELLRNDPNIILVEQTEEWEIPEVDYTLFDEEEIEYVKGAIGNVMNILSRDYVIDIFVCHNYRREWLHDFKDKHGISTDQYEQIHQSALRINIIGSLFNTLRLIKESYTGSNPDKINELVNDVLDRQHIINVLGFNESGYSERVLDQLEPMEKYHYAKDLKQKSFKFLQAISVQE